MAPAVNARGTEFKSSAHQTTGTVLEDCKHHAGVWDLGGEVETGQSQAGACWPPSLPK